MQNVIITGSSGLVGAACVRFFSAKGFDVIGIDNNMRSYFFGKDGSTDWSKHQLEKEILNYKHYDVDIRDEADIKRIFSEYSSDIKLVIHCAAQPSHDWAAKEPLTDFSVNAGGTLQLLEASRIHCPDAVFIYCSTNKVYGDRPNSLPLIELDTRFEVAADHPYSEHGIDENMNLDQCTHSLFGVSKLSADIAVQEYGRYFGMKTAIFRGGCLTGPGHSGAMLHGFLAYLMKCAIRQEPYKVLGYKGKQVRDNIHCYDLANCFYHFYQNPRIAEVYNIGGSRHSNCSMLEAINLCEKISGNKMQITHSDANRIGDHIWWISDVRKFKSHYPDWTYKYSLQDLMLEIHDELIKRPLP